MAKDEHPPDNEIGGPNQATEGAARFIGGAGFRDTGVSLGKIRNYDRIGDPTRTEKTAKEILEAGKGNSFKRDDQSFKDLAERPKSETKVNEPSPPVKETDISNLLETHKTPAVSAIEKHLKELGSKATPDSSRQESPRHGERTPDKEQNQSRENVQKTPAVSAIEKGMEEQLKNPADASMKKEKEPTKDKTKEKDINPDR